MICFSIEPLGVLVCPWQVRTAKVVSAGAKDALVLALAHAADASLRNILTETMNVISTMHMGLQLQCDKLWATVVLQELWTISELELQAPVSGAKLLQQTYNRVGLTQSMESSSFPLLFEGGAYW
jgi:hypothetical protein